MKPQNPTGEFRDALMLSQPVSTGDFYKKRAELSPNYNQTQGHLQSVPSGSLFRWATRSIQPKCSELQVPEQKALCIVSVDSA